MRERELIAKIRKSRGARGRRGNDVRVGIGDDCAVLRLKPGYEALVTTDFSLEGVHFRREWHSPERVGHRCLTRGLSDIAAMGGEPVAAFLSLALPRGIEQRWVDGFFRGLLRLAKQYSVALAGGDTAQSPTGVLADIVVVGQAPKGEALLRSGAKAGDGIYVTGALGRAGAELRRLSAAEAPARQPERAPALQPRVAVGLALRELASACIDVSDGLSTDLNHVCEESGVGAVVEAEAVPVAKGATLQDALHGGEDYELLFTSSQAVPEKIADVKVTLIGEIVGGAEMTLVDAAGRKKTLEAKGWEHFAGSR